MALEKVRDYLEEVSAVPGCPNTPCGNFGIALVWHGVLDEDIRVSKIISSHKEAIMEVDPASQIAKIDPTCNQN